MTELGRKIRFPWEHLLLWGSFFVFVLAGVTGSSLGWFRQDPVCNEVIELQGERRLAGVYRGIRGDEFIAHGVNNAIAQYNAAPRFPRYNRNEGLGGRDLLVLHDVGAPVKHSSMIGRPACWGFFFFDLRRALAWYWWLPVFLATQFTLLFLRELFDLDRLLSWVLTAGIVAGPCAAAWSFWPLNNMYGLLMGAWALLRFSRSRNVWAQFGWAVLGGWGCFCAALSLYFPRLVSIGLVAGCAAVAAVLTDRERWAGFSRVRSWFAGAAGVLPFLLLLLVWFCDCREALESIAATTYPGMRRMNGGDLALWEAMRGWLAPLTVYRSPLTNQSESQAPLALYLPLLLWTLCARKRLKRPALFYSVAGSMIFLLIYQFAGLPGPFAALTAWNRCNPYRCMMALHMGQFILLAQICEESREKPLFRFPLPVALGVGFGMAVLSFLLLFTAPKELIGEFAGFYPAWWIPAGALALSFLVLWAAGSALFSKPKYGAILLAAFSFLLGAVFNPLCLAPKVATSRLLPVIARTPDQKHGGRVLFATENDFAASCHFLGGGKTLNGYFMYPDKRLHGLLYASQPEPGRFLRMNHLDAEIDAEGGERFFAEPRYSDRIVLHFGPKYDFSRLPIDFLAALRTQKELLLPNPCLRLVHEGENLVLFQVRRP